MRELPEYQGLLDRAREGRGQAFFVVGEPGGGKTHLLRQVSAMAAARFRVGSAQADAVESRVGLGLMSQVLGAVSRQREPSSAGLLLTATTRAEAFARALSTIEAAASSGPVLLVLDDLHDADPDSLALIAFLSRRVAGLPVAIVGALRPWPADAVNLLGQLPESAVKLKRLARLDDAGLRHLFREATGRVPDAGELAGIAELSHGNPLLAWHLARRASRKGSPGDILENWRRTELRGLVERFIGSAGCSLRVAGAASVFGEEFRPALAVRAAGCDPAEARAALERLFQAGIMCALSGGSARFVHPALRGLVYAGLGPTARAELHIAAMVALLDHGTEVSEAAEHGLRAEAAGDPATVGVLAHAGREALAQGRMADARRYLEAGVAMAANGARPNLVVSLGQVRLASGEPEAALALFRGLFRSPLARHGDLVLARRWVARALFASGHPDDAEAELAAAAEAAESLSNSAAVARARIDQAAIALLTRGPAQAVEAAAGARAAAAGATPALRLAAEATWSACAYELGQPASLAALDAVVWRMAREPVPAISSLTWSWGLLGTCYLVNRLAERWPEAEAAFAAVYPAAVRLRLPMAVAALAGSRAEDLLLRGRLEEARTLVETAVAAAGSAPLAAASAASAMSVLTFEAGQLSESARWLQAARDAAPTVAVAPVLIARLDHLSALHDMQAGRFESASRAYARVEALLVQGGFVDPSFIPWAHSAVAVHVGAGDMRAAERVQSWLEAGAAAVPARWPAAMAACGRGHLAGARGETGAAHDAFAEAAAILELIGFPLACADALINCGRVLRLRGHVRDARAVFSRAWELSHLPGGARLAESARLEMQISGGRVRQHTDPTHLTPQERRVARMASGGLSDREIARTLSISPKTVETHLTRIYRKLDVRGRRDLMIKGTQTAGAAAISMSR